MAKNYVTSFRGDHYFTPNAKNHVKDEPVTPIEEDFGDHNRLDSYDDDQVAMRRSLSMSDVAALRDDLLSLELHSDKEDVYQRYRRPTNAPQDLSRSRFVSMAEAIYHYQRDTPGRFHSTRPQNFRPQGATGPSGLTVPQSPTLRCRARSRQLHILSQKEKEELELEELKKFKIKANPIPKSVIEGSKNLPEVLKKPLTVPEPFKLTEIHKKLAQSPEPITFKARPVPKHILEKPNLPPKPQLQPTKPVTPKFHYKRANGGDMLKPENKYNGPAANHKSSENGVHKNGPAANQKSPKPLQKCVQRHGPIRPEPFSFQGRDEELKRLKEERIKQQIEYERKQASQFKAQPLPGAVIKRMRSATAKSSASTASSENKENHRFEARPPAVLYKLPFKPVLQTLPLVKQVPFELTTEKRAAERERFDKQLKEKEQEQEMIRLQREKERQEADEKIKAVLRAKLVHHAKPVPADNQFVPEKSMAPLTVPETPTFVRRLRDKN